VGFNDIMNGSAEIKMDFKELIDSLLDTNQIPIISGRFSRILSLHNWLRDYCNTVGVTFNFFDTFWKLNAFNKEVGSTPIICIPGSLQHHKAAFRQ
jgi:hypothetical protein